jgi:hypothetical protein
MTKEIPARTPPVIETISVYQLLQVQGEFLSDRGSHVPFPCNYKYPMCLKHGEHPSKPSSDELSRRVQLSACLLPCLSWPRAQTRIYMSKSIYSSYIKSLPPNKLPHTLMSRANYVSASRNKDEGENLGKWIPGAQQES